MSLGIEVVLTMITAIVGISGVLKTIIDLFIKKKRDISKITIQGKNGDKIEIPADIPVKDIEKLLRKVSAIDIDDILKYDKTKNEEGFVISEFFLYFVPGVIALLFAGTFIYLIVSHQQDPNYTTPKELSSAMTMIIGYFFGIGVSSAANKGKTLTENDIKRIIDGAD